MVSKVLAVVDVLSSENQVPITVHLLMLIYKYNNAIMNSHEQGLNTKEHTMHI